MAAFRWVRLLLGVAMLVAGLALLLSPAYAQSPEEQVYVLTYDGDIGPNAERYFSRGIEMAEVDGAALVVIKLDTPGGSLSSTEKIVERLLGAEVPVAVYVYPPGAFAASAGTFVTAAANFAVMAEGTSIGAASPVAADGEDLPDTLSEKAINITVAMAEGIAEKRGRDKEALTKTITESEAYTASVAVEVGLVDFVAVNIQDLLEQLDGRETETALGTVTMRTAGLVEREVDRNLAEKFFSFVANPNVIGLLLTFGSIGLFVELLNPGLIVPGVVGALALIVGLVALGALPFNWAGVVLLGLAAILIFLEIQVPGIGFLGVGGVIAFVLGALLLFSVGEPDWPGAPVLRISFWLVAILSGMMAFFALVIVGAVVRTRKLKYASSVELLIGQTGQVLSELNPVGNVQLKSETWSAVSSGEGSIGVGDKVEVVEVDGLTIKVRKA